MSDKLQNEQVALLLHDEAKRLTAGNTFQFAAERALISALCVAFVTTMRDPTDRMAMLVFQRCIINELDAMQSRLIAVLGQVGAHDTDDLMAQPARGRA